MILMIKGEIEDWKKTRKLFLRTQLITGTFGKNEEPYQVSINIDNKAIFVEFPESIVVTYHTSDLIEEAIKMYKEMVK